MTTQVPFATAPRFLVGFPSGQRDQTVNLAPLASKVRILPPPQSRNAPRDFEKLNVAHAGVAQLVELQPSKLDVAGSNPVSRSAALDPPQTQNERGLPKTRGRTSARRAARHAHIAQLVEHVLGKDEVTRSIRVVGSSRG